MSPTQPSRRNFLKGQMRGSDKAVLRPPRAASDFAALCEGCWDCAKACPENIIVPGEDRRPVVDFSRGACTFCGDCAEACPTGALDPDNPLIWNWKAEVASDCLSLKGVTCRTCEDMCEAQAIRFKLGLGGTASPIVDTDLCTGCGSCSKACPVNAVSFKHQIKTEHEVPK